MFTENALPHADDAPPFMSNPQHTELTATT